MTNHDNPTNEDDKSGLVDTAISAALWSAGVSWIIPMMGSMMAAQTVFRSDQIEWLNRLYTRGQIALTGSKWRAVVDPAVDPGTPYMFCQNHTNHFDHCAVYNATPHFKQGLELESHFKYPIYGWFMKQRGTIAVRPGKQGQTPEIMAHMRDEVNRGHSILAFPEGTRSRTGRVGPFRKGVFFMARDLGIPIVPVAVTGMFDVMRPGSLHIRPGKEVTVYCDAPIETAGVADEAIGALADRVRTVVAARVDDYFDGAQR